MLEIEQSKRPTAAQLVAEFQGHIDQLSRISSRRPTNIRHSFHPPAAKKDNMRTSNLPPHHASTVWPSSIQLTNGGSIPADQRVSVQPTKQPKPTRSASVHSASSAKPTLPPKPRHSRISTTHTANHGQRKTKRPSVACETRQLNLEGIQLAGQERPMPPAIQPVPNSGIKVSNPGLRIPLATAARPIPNTTLHPSTASPKSQVSQTPRSGHCANPIPTPKVKNPRPPAAANPVNPGQDNRSKVADAPVMKELHHSFFNTPELISGIPKKHRRAIRKDQYYYLTWQRLCEDPDFQANPKCLPIFASLANRLLSNPAPLIQLTNLYAANGDYQSAVESGEALLSFNSDALKRALIGKSTGTASIQK